MRIAFVIYSLAGGGAERVTAILSQYWSSIGHQVKIVTFADEAINFYDPGPGVEVESLRRDATSKNVWHAIVWTLTRVSALRPRLKAFKPDVVIGMMNTTSAHVAMASLGLPCIAVGAERTYPPRAPLTPFRQFVYGLCCGLLGGVIAQTKETAQWIKSRTTAREVFVIPNPLVWPLEKREPFLFPEDTCPSGRSIVLAVGRLSP